MNRKEHWEQVYTTKAEGDLSWFQAEPQVSLGLIRSVGSPSSRVIDVGGGASVLVDRLLGSGFTSVAVLDISREALNRAAARLGERADSVRWIEADVTRADGLGPFDVWHDRAVFHFLTGEADRRKYVELAGRSIACGGHLIVATFALHGPHKCSGLEVCRYDGSTLATELGESFTLVEETEETHITPQGSSQAFFYGVFRRQEIPA